MSMAFPRRPAESPTPWESQEYTSNSAPCEMRWQKKGIFVNAAHLEVSQNHGGYPSHHPVTTMEMAIESRFLPRQKYAVVFHSY